MGEGGKMGEGGGIKDKKRRNKTMINITIRVSRQEVNEKTKEE